MLTTSKDYWISPTALYIALNALGNPDYIQASCVSGAQILVYVKGIIDYDAGHNYRRWKLQASPTVFNTHTEKYVYVAIPRDTHEDNAFVVFPSEQIDIYGQNEAGQQLGSTEYYYIFLQGVLTSSGDNGSINRTWHQTIVTGYLSSDEAIAAGASDSEWFSYSNVSGVTTFLKNLTMKIGTEFIQLFARTITIVTGGAITFEQGGQVNGVANSTTPDTATDKIATPSYVADHSLSKAHNDKTDFDIELQNLRVNGKADVFGNLSIGNFNKGIQGAQVDLYGNAEFESIVARSFLEVPELRYNRTTITVGNKWQTVGAGIIERVWAGNTALAPYAHALEGVAKLKLEDGEIGAIAVNDKCQGVFHFNSGNDTETTDERNGNFHFAGFTTVYFLIREIFTAETLPDVIKQELAAAGETPQENQYFRYELRAHTCADLPATNPDRWTDTTHPQPSMNFACYANATNSDRQSSRLTTTTYQLHLAGMTGWTYNQNNIRVIIGWLDGFSLMQRVWDKEKKEFVEAPKDLQGEGIAVGNMYMWGAIDQFDRAPSIISQQVYFRATNTPVAPNGIIVSPNHSRFTLNGWKREPITPSVQDRVVWQQLLYTYSDGTYDVSDVSLHAIDPSELIVELSRSLVSVAISDFYDVSLPDDVQFDITARLLSGDTPLAITSAIAEYDSQGATLSYTTTPSDDQKSVVFHITLHGFVGVNVDGATPEDSFVRIQLASAYGSSSAVVTVAQNIKGEDGEPGEPGQKGDDGTSVSIKGSAIRYYPDVTLYENDNTKVEGLYIVYGRRRLSVSGSVLESGAYVYMFDGTNSEISVPEIGDTYVSEENGHMYVCSINAQEYSPGRTYWADCGEIKGQDAVSYSLDVPNVILEGKIEFPITVIKTDGSNTRRLSYSECVANELTVTGAQVQWTADNQRFFLQQGAVKGTTYDITLRHQGRTLFTHQVQCVGNGDRGYVGVSIRRSEWEPGVYYRNDTADGSADNDGNRYLDEVSITDPATGQAQWYVAREAHNGVKSSDSNRPTGAGTTLWQQLNNMSPVRTSYADIQNAFIQFLQVAQLTISNAGGIYGAFGGGTDWPLWFGGKSWNEAVFRVGRNGDAYLGNNFSVVGGHVTARDITAIGGTFSGFIKKAKTEITKDNFLDVVKPITWAQDAYHLDFDKSGSWISFKSVPDAFARGGELFVYPDSFSPGRQYCNSRDDARAMIGNTVLLYNETPSASQFTLAVTGNVSYTETPNMFTMIPVARGELLIMHCRIGYGNGGEEKVYWECEKVNIAN